jgi:hypothetical protein
MCCVRYELKLKKRLNNHLCCVRYKLRLKKQMGNDPD